MLDTVEFKILQSDARPWEDTCVAWGHVCENTKQAQELAKSLANLTGWQVRWNWVDSFLGHYIYPDHVIAMP